MAEWTVERVAERFREAAITAPGSSTNMMVSFFLAQHGIKPTDVSFIGVGAGAGAITALRSGQIDAIANLDPVISTLVKEDAIHIIADTRTLADAQTIFGGNMPAGCLYAAQTFIDANPNTTQALTNAMVRADKWIQASSADDIAALVPQSYLLGDPDLYKLALKGNREALSPDGLVPEDGPQTALNALAEFVPNFDRTAIDISRIWTNQFAAKANQQYPHA